jgi:hypothetical protein
MTRFHRTAASHRCLFWPKLALRFAVLMLAFMPASAQAHMRHFNCTPQFPLQLGQTNGWLGADAAYSIPRRDGRDVWVFGDTLHGKKRVVNDKAPRMVRNSLGISTCKGGQWHIHYVIRKNAQGEPRSFFAPQHPHTWFRALDGFLARHDLWVTLLCVQNEENAKSNALGFGFCGAEPARISNLGPDPQKWTIRYVPLVPNGTDAYPSDTALLHGRYAYIFAQWNQGTRPLLATRIPLSGLSDPAAHLQYLANSGQWKTGFDPANAKPVMKRGISELSIRYHPRLKRWLAVMFSPEGFSSKIILRTAPSFLGPWSPGQVIYNVPTMHPGNPGYSRSTFCYAGKEHPEFEHGAPVFTYVCNTMSVSSLATNLNIYFPKVVRMSMPSFKY